jgi:hypothetical protein
MLIRTRALTCKVDSPDANDAQPMPNKREESPSEVATTFKGVSLGAQQDRTMAYNHAGNAEKTAAYKTSRIAYSTLEDVRPTKFGQDTWCYVPKRDNPLGCRRRHEIESGGKDNNI